MSNSKKRGRPKGSKNKETISKKKHQRIEEMSSAQDEFEREFSILPPTIEPTTTMMTPCLEVEDAAATNHNGNGIEDDEEIGFEFNGNDVEDSDGEDNGVVEQVGFGHADEFDVLEVLEYGTEIKKKIMRMKLRKILSRN